MTIYVHLVRHAQGYHNLNTANHQLPDPDLTFLGVSQCEALRDKFAHHDAITYLVASPMRRTIYTCLHAFAPAVAAGKKVIALPEIQEVSNLPCDVGSEPARLKREFDEASQVDLGLVHDGWNDKQFPSPWAPEMSRLEARARTARRWLRELGRKGAKGAAGGDIHIAVVTHGGFLHFLADDFHGLVMEKGTGWDNTECRTYEFVNPEGDDADAMLQETSASWKQRRGSVSRPSETEQMELRAAFENGLKEEFGEA